MTAMFVFFVADSADQRYYVKYRKNRHELWVISMAAEVKQKVLELFSRENGPFSVHEIMDRLAIPSNALVNVAIFELVRQETIVQASEMPPKWQLRQDSSSETADTSRSIGNDGTCMQH